MAQRPFEFQQGPAAEAIHEPNASGSTNYNLAGQHNNGKKVACWTKVANQIITTMNSEAKVGAKQGFQHPMGLSPMSPSSFATMDW